MNAFSPVVPHISPRLSVGPSDAFPCGAVWGAYNAVLTAAFDNTRAMLNLFDQAGRVMMLPFNLHAAIEHAVQEEELGTRIYPANCGASFGIEQTIIDGKIVPVGVAFHSITREGFSNVSTCDVWHFSNPQHIHKPTMVLVAPYSGSRSTVMRYLAKGFLPDRNVVVVGWVEPHNLPKNITFDLTDNIEDIGRATQFLPRLGITDFDMMFVSQSGVSGSIAVNLPAENSPTNIIIAGSPLDTRRNRTAMNWMAEFNALPENIFVPVGDHARYAGKGRNVIPHEVMHALYRCTPDVPGKGFESISLAAEHVRQGHQEIFRDNLLARGEYVHHGKKVSLGTFTGGLMTIAAENDSIVSPDQTEAAADLFTGKTRYGNLRLTAHEIYGRGSRASIGHYDLVKPGAPLDRMVREVIAFTRR